MREVVKACSALYESDRRFATDFDMVIGVQLLVVGSSAEESN